MILTRCAFGAAILISSVCAHAARPLDTDDAGVIPKSSCELEGSSVKARVAGAKTRQLGAALACGVGGGTQVGLGLSRSRVTGEPRSSGAGLTAKASVWQGAGEEAAAVSLGAALAWDKPSAGKWTAQGRQVRLLVTQPLASLTLHANLGHARDVAAATNATLWGLALEHEPIAVGGIGLAPMVEFFGDDHGDRWANIGLRVTVMADRLWLDVSAARQQVGDKAKLTNAGFKFAF